MKRIPLSMETYQHVSTPLASKRLLNMFAEKQPDDARVAAALVPVAGLRQFIAAGVGPVTAINDDQPGSIYFVSGTHFYRMELVGGVWTTFDLGDIGTPTGGFNPDYLFYSIAVGPNAAVVCSPPNAYVSAAGAPVQQITTTWPDYGASSVAYLDGYFVFTGQTAPQFFFITKLADPTHVDALDFAALDAFPNTIGKVMTLGTDLWFAGASGWEIWYDAGNADFPFRRRPNGIIGRSVLTAKSVAKGDERLYWLSADGIIYRSNGYHPERISTHGIEQSLGAGVHSAYVYNQQGHIFYVLNLGDRSLVYDAATTLWHTASSGSDGSGPWRGACCTANTGLPLIGDSGAGRILQTDTTLSTDMAVAVQRQVVLPPLYAGTERAFCSRLEIEMDVVSPRAPPQVVLEWSDDGGYTYTGARTMTISGSDKRKRVFTTRLGSFRDRVFRVTAQHAMTIYAIDCDITVGAS